MVSKLPAFFAAYPDMAVEMAASESATTIIEDGFDLAIHSGDLSGLEPGCAKIRADDDHSRRHSSIPDGATVRRYRRTISAGFDLSFLSSGAPYSRGALDLDKTRSVSSPQEFSEPAILNR